MTETHFFFYFELLEFNYKFVLILLQNLLSILLDYKPFLLSYFDEDIY